MMQTVLTPELIVAATGAVSTAAASAFAVWRAVKTVLNGSAVRIQKIAEDQDVYQRETRDHLSQIVANQGRVSEELLLIRRDVTEIHKHGCDRYQGQHGKARD